MTQCYCNAVTILDPHEGNNYQIKYLSEIISFGWNVLYQCKNCKKYWKKYYPQSYQHGGGEAKYEKLQSYFGMTIAKATQRFIFEIRHPRLANFFQKIRKAFRGLNYK